MPSKHTPEHRAYMRKIQRAVRERNYAFVAEVNSRTACAHCGAQPIEWHNPEHVELNRQKFRISVLVRGASIATIQGEMSRCTPLCRRCHMAEDGRLNRLVALQHPRGTQNGRSKLTDNQVAEMKRRLLNGEEGKRLGKEFGVSQQVVSQIHRGVRWKHISPASVRHA